MELFSSEILLCSKACIWILCCIFYLQYWVISYRVIWSIENVMLYDLSFMRYIFSENDFNKHTDAQKSHTCVGINSLILHIYVWSINLLI